MTPDQVVKQAQAWLELAKVRANPEHEAIGGYRRQVVPVDAGTLLECLDVAPARSHPAWAGFRGDLVAGISQRMVPLRVPAIESIIMAMTPDAPKGAKREMTDG